MRIHYSLLALLLTITDAAILHALDKKWEAGVYTNELLEKTTLPVILII
jgi:hypothetical protein